MSRRFRARISENLSLNSDHYILSLANLEQMEEPRPGQFFMIEVNPGYDPLLKRPFSLYRRTPDGFEILYRVRGKGTAILRDMKEGMELDVLGPLGSSYPLPSEDQIPVIIAGGIGMASIHSLVEKVSKTAYVVYGARSEGDLFMRDELGRVSKDLLLCTDDGTCGHKGTVIDVVNGLRSRLREAGEIVVYACGPVAMIRGAAQFAAAHGIRAYVSLEEHMACGLGACLGCVVKSRSGYKRVCKEGPVFDAAEIVW